jgi:hypothetical protein
MTMMFSHIDESEINDLFRVMKSAGHTPDDFDLSEEGNRPCVIASPGVLAWPAATVTVTNRRNSLSHTYRLYGYAWIVAFENDLRSGRFDR